MKMNRMQILLMTAMVLFSKNSLADVEVSVGKIEALLTDTQYFGHCMILIPYNEPTINCREGWVSVDCSADFNSKETTRRLWDSAQLAYATDSFVRVMVNDTKIHNSYCVVDRLDIVK